MKSSIFEFTEYKQYLKAFVSQSSGRGQIAKLADAAGCQASYLSQVLNSKVQITPDHALGIGKHLNLSQEELDYWLMLVELGRASTPELRSYLSKKLEEARQKAQDIGNRLKRDSIRDDAEALSQYYSSWLFVALHILSSVKEFQTLEQLSQRLSLRKDILLQTLEKLSKLGFIEKQGSLWRFVGRELHVPRQSPLVSLHHQNWRQRAVLDAQAATSESIHFTGVYSISKSDYLKIKELILSTIENCNKVSGPSVPEDAVCILLDLFWV